ncbi:ABC transporter permease (plasmid) [Deinococcus radiomollis]|uniref:ABC transporter permease n=1 Tax=Deinococcus radiomollis TaxID=468916 RepID=UPI0038916847
MTAIPVARAARPGRSKTFRRFTANRLGVIGLVVVVVLTVMALLAPYIAPFDPAKQDFSALLQPASRAHWLGTDELGRDTLTRVMYGARISLSAGLVSVALALLVGTLLGLISGFVGGWLDELIGRFIDALLAFPFLILAITLASVLGPSLQNTMLAIAIVTTPAFARVTRAQVLAQRELEYVQAAGALGAGSGRTLLRHILPNISGALIVQTSLAIAEAVLAESTLSFLGLGVQPPTPSWGSMLNTARGYLQTAPWLALAPGVIIFATVLAFNLLGDGLRDALDPRGKTK